MAKTYREQFDEAMRCTTRDEATVWLAHEVFRYRQEFGMEASKAIEVIKANLGYMAGYCDAAATHKIKELFDADHPIFRSADYHSQSVGDKILTGMAWARKAI